MDINSVYNNSDVIFHYTKLSTALDYILDTRIDGRTLRCSPRKNSLDPWEKYEEYLPMKFDFEGSDIDVEDERVSSLYNNFKQKLNNSKQTCFCKNLPSTKVEENTSHSLNQMGYLKARMWERYADGFNGVCLAFSKPKLKSNNTSFSSKSINYRGFEDLPERGLKIKLGELNNQDGYHEIEKTFDKQLEEILYSKYFDYRDENEFRFYSHSHYEQDYLNITDALKGIFFIQKNVSAFAVDSLRAYAKQHKADLIGVKWTVFGVGYNIYK